MNPELRRNLWLELTLHRLLALPLGFALLLMLVRTLAGDDAPRAISVLAAALFGGFTCVWGGIQAGESILGELRARTWDGQRLSSLEPWTMTWGKLAGAPAFAWYGGAICLVAYLAFSPETDKLLHVGLLLAGAILLHSAALIGGIMAARRGLVRASSTGWMLGLMIVLLGPVVALLSRETDILWWGRERAAFVFYFASATVFAAWSVFGAHRLMCHELRVRTTPWAWVAFLLFIALYISGFGIRSRDTFGEQAGVFLLAGLIVALIATYPLLFSEASGAMVVRRVLLRVAARDWRRALQQMPLWPVSLALGLLFCVLSVLFAGLRSSGTEWFGAAVLPPIPLFLLVARDAALYMFFALAIKPGRAEAATLFYLILLYWLVPMLLRASGAERLADFILPPFWERPGLAAGVAAIQAACIVGAVLWRWRKNYGS